MWTRQQADEQTTETRACILCGKRIGHQMYVDVCIWREARDFIFCDSHCHKAWHDSKEVLEALDV